MQAPYHEGNTNLLNPHNNPSNYAPITFTLKTRKSWQSA